MCSQAECAESIEEPSGVLVVHVIASCAGLAMATLQEQDLLGYSGGDGGGKAAFAGGDTREVRDVSQHWASSRWRPSPIIWRERGMHEE